MENRELASVVTTDKPYEFPAVGTERFHVVCYDFGVKTNSLRELSQKGCRITVVPSGTSANEVFAMKPDGVFLSGATGRGWSDGTTLYAARGQADRGLHHRTIWLASV